MDGPGTRRGGDGMTDTDNRNIIERLGAVHRELGPIAKAQVEMNRSSFMAFRVDDVYAHLGPLFAKHGVVVVPRVVDAVYRDITSKANAKGVSVRVTVEYDFVAPDMSGVTMTFRAEGDDYGDKATNKAVQQAIKYGLIQMFQIATGEVDPDAIPIDPAVVDETERTITAVTAAFPDIDTARSVWMKVADTIGHVPGQPMDVETADRFVSMVAEVASDSTHDGTEPAATDKETGETETDDRIDDTTGDETNGE